MINGTQNPVVGNDEIYQYSDSLDIFNSSNATYVWNIWKKKQGKWVNITAKPPKMGQKVSFKFGEKVIGEEFKLEVFKAIPKFGSDDFDAKLVGEIIVIPASSKIAKITKVVLFNNGAKDPNKATYKDYLTARAYCITMFNKEVEFQLWEDDAEGKGHNPQINKNNKLPQKFIARVNEKGIAETKISLLSNEKVLKGIADKYLSAGDKNEGANHEYYVTATYEGRIQGASQVNVNVKNPGTQPKKDSAIFPGTSNKPPKSDKEGKVTHAYFIDSKGNPTQRIKVGDSVRIRVKTVNMIKEDIQYIVWEKDTIDALDDRIFTSPKMKIIDDISDTPALIITQEKYNKGIDANWNYSADSDKDQQQYYIEIIPLNTKAKSVSFGIDDEDKRTKVDNVRSTAVVKPKAQTTTKNCGEKFCIKIGSPNSELIREINIRLAGFGGNVPTDEFTNNSEKMVKQFQRDYMKIPETGKVCGNVLKAIDDFCNKYTEQINDYKCPCQNPNNSGEKDKAAKVDRCPEGWGKGLYSEQYLKVNITEPHRKYEYPGMHRSTLWAVSAMKFYLDFTKSVYSKYDVNRGYRCWADNNFHNRKSTNHFGKAADIRFNKNGKRTKLASDANQIRTDIFNKYLNAKWWGNPNMFALEKESDGAVTYVHVDCRDFALEYHENKFFVKTQNAVIGKSIVQLANDLGFNDMCLCGGGNSARLKKVDSKKNKFKWAHSEFGNLLAKEESGDNYNICNKTKGGYKQIKDLKIVEMTIKDIQTKQKDRDVFAVGRYQLIPKTFSGAINSLSLDLSAFLDEEMQDKIFDEYLIKIKRPKIIAYLEGEGSIEDAMYASAQEWASVGVEKGKKISDKVVKDKKGKELSRTKRTAIGGESYYANDGFNKSHITPEEIKNALKNSKNANE
ncbi:peptidoglycan-binding domain-containing protein [Frigoriflavimonas asaccharolytica]|uniref:Uncharacterized protein n=1 Tax=Frigoriflavimonas asaccharolytica TaxID=2735899 RepID=A0A8J8GDY8_9FLAO|nr:peptidoglycan-binding domain-containing protein [Frigoriflavimonas asaccharolytica]NRS94072.1 hypothetical protein [Frigoriflavimonas asaccharolytica]